MWSFYEKNLKNSNIHNFANDSATWICAAFLIWNGYVPFYYFLSQLGSLKKLDFSILREKLLFYTFTYSSIDTLKKN